MKMVMAQDATLDYQGGLLHMFFFYFVADHCMCKISIEKYYLKYGLNVENEN